MNVMIVTLLLIVVALSLYIWFLKKGQSKNSLSIETPAEVSPAAPQPHESSLRDFVTGLYNQKHLIQRLRDCMGRAERENKVMALIMWDIDGFADFNNEFGQDEGNKFLLKVAASIKKTLRSYDEAFRTGADEFCAIVYPADQLVSDEVTKRVSELVSKELFQEDLAYVNRKFSISSGTVFYPSGNKIPEALVHSARQALYKFRHTAPLSN